MKLKFPARFARLLWRATTTTVAIAATVAAVAWFAGMFEHKIAPDWTEQGQSRHTDQPTDVVHEVEKAYVEEAVGTLKASSRTIVSAKLLATIEEIMVTAGDQVTQGQVLVRLDNKEYETRLAQANRALEAAAANRRQADRQFERAQVLQQREAISQSDFDDAERNVQVATAEESRAKQAVNEAEVMLSYTTIKAAKNGRIVDRLAEPGDIAQPGAPILVLYDATSLRLEAPVMEHRAVRLRVGDELQVHIDALKRKFQAVVDEIVPQADAPSRSFLVKANLPRSEDLYEGMFGRLLIPAGQRRHLCLATDAIVRIGQLEFVDVVLPDGMIERRLIKSGQLGMPGRQEVLSGVEAGERVILHNRPGADQPSAADDPSRKANLDAAPR